MRTQIPIAIVGGGPAGAFAASLLAARGHKVVLFDEKLAWEKPCGGSRIGPSSNIRFLAKRKPSAAQSSLAS